MNLDQIDTRLYEELQRDGRASIEEIAGVLGLSRVAVRARFTRLVDSGALRVIGIVHPSAQGFRIAAHLSISVTGSARSVGFEIAHLEAVSLVSVVAGRAALIAEAHATNMTELRALIRTITMLDGVAHVESAVYTERITDLYAPPGIVTPTSLDDVDHQIIEALKANGRASYAEIARTTNFSSSAIRGRVHQLTSRGVVRISAVMTPGTLGLRYMCGFGLRLRGGTETTCATTIGEMPAVSYLSLTLSRWDAIGTLLARSHAEVVGELDRIRSTPGVDALECWTHLAVIKENHQLTFTSTKVPPSLIS